MGEAATYRISPGLIGSMAWGWVRALAALVADS